MPLVTPSDVWVHTKRLQGFEPHPADLYPLYDRAHLVLMLAARLHAGESRLRLEDVPVPEPTGDEVLVRVAGAGVCRSDLHVLDGGFEELVRPPGDDGPRDRRPGRGARAGAPLGSPLGDPVAVMVGWGCGSVRWCVAGHEQLCPDGREAGATADGGFAEYVLVPHRRLPRAARRPRLPSRRPRSAARESRPTPR